MKKSIKTSLLIVAALSIIYALAGTAILPYSIHGSPIADSSLIKTHWKQMGGFEKYTPDHLRLGCWSTALAQIVYYHHLKPFGYVAYVSSKGYRINENIDSSKINLSRLSFKIDSMTSRSEIDDLARYNYYAAIAIEKDFGTDNYMHKLASAGLLEKHYSIKVSRYISWQHILPYTTGKLENIISEEINHKRPVFLHFTNLKNFGHSVVIDGYNRKGDNFMVHLNQGQGGPQDGWYNFDKDLLKEGDRSLRVIYTIKPITI
ncbi:MAG: hypothetical protein JWR09_2965 [Mucilaginibacter sp.]|nr:hypothetical protein [Mucilaginibacter sp.]